MKIKTLCVSTIFAAILLAPTTQACDIAVVSAEASGRPFIWKNRDHPSDWRQELRHKDSATGGYIIVVDRTGLSNIPSGGVNGDGFAIANTTVYENFFLDLINNNHVLLEDALNRCSTVDDFDSLAKGWAGHLSGNFVVIDAQGGAALYECYSAVPSLKINRFDANSGDVTDINGELIGKNGELGGYAGQWRGFLNRTNSHSWIKLEDDTCREVRAREILNELADQDALNYRYAMSRLARDINPWDYKNGQSIKSSGLPLAESERLKLADNSRVDTHYSISRYQTNLGLVVDGVTPGEDPIMTTFWCNLGEPAAGIFTPHFAAAKDVSNYTKTIEEPSINSSDKSSLLNSAIYAKKNELLYADSEQIISLSALRELQQWSLPLEYVIVMNTERFLAEGSISAGNLFDFSSFCSGYAYLNYTAGSAHAHPFDFNLAGHTPITIDEVVAEEYIEPPAINAESQISYSQAPFIAKEFLEDDASDTCFINSLR